MEIIQLEAQKSQYKEDLKDAETSDEKIRIINLIKYINERIKKITG